MDGTRSGSERVELCAGSAMSHRQSATDQGGVLWTVLVGVICLVFVPDVTAQPGAESPETSVGQSTTVAGELGFERLGEDYYVTIAGKFELKLPVPKIGCGGVTSEGCTTRFRVGVQAPFRLRAIDRAPTSDSLLRSEDWDEVGDYLEVVRYVEYGRPAERLHTRIGELGSVVVGHGTIVNHYHNVVTPDHFRLGLNAHWNEPFGGASLLVNDLAGPAILGSRVYVRPWHLVDESSWMTRLAVGMSIVSDVQAPVQLQRDPNDQPIVGPSRFPEVSERRPTAIGGLDVELKVVDTKVVGLTPYTDANHHFGLGSGLHSGFLFEVAPFEKLRFSSRLEYRLLGPRYLPHYYGPLYEIDRFQFTGWGTLLPEPKLRVAADPRDRVLHGGYGELTAQVLEIVSVTGAYADHMGPANSWARLSAHVSAFERFQLGLFYFKRGVEDFGNLFEREGAFVVGEGRFGVYGPLYLKAAYSRLWQLRDDGTYKPIDRWNLGVGASFTF